MKRIKIVTINTPQKDFRIVSMNRDALEALHKFHFEKLIKCPRDRRRNFVKNEGDIAKLIPNVRRTKSLFSPSICSGLRGDGSRHKDQCLYFMGYVPRQVICRLSPSKRVNIEEYADCPKLERIVKVGVNRDQIEIWGSGALTNVSRSVCEKCEYFVEVKDEYSCTFKTGCDNSILALMFCTSLDCKKCKNNKKRGGEINETEDKNR